MKLLEATQNFFFWKRSRLGLWALKQRLSRLRLCFNPPGWDLHNVSPAAPDVGDPYQATGPFSSTALDLGAELRIFFQKQPRRDLPVFLFQAVFGLGNWDPHTLRCACFRKSRSQHQSPPQLLDVGLFWSLLRRSSP